MLAQITRRTGSRSICAAVVRAGTSRGTRQYVQPSGADRASVMDVPSALKDDMFTPRPGQYISLGTLLLAHSLSLDMLGFKLEMPTREGSVEQKERPIYLDMQVCRDDSLVHQSD
jgi:cysteine desulfurase